MPTRVIPKNYRNITGISSSSKAEGDSAFESSLERDFYALLEFDNSVYRYEVQPVTISYLAEDDKVKTYTPDVLVDYVRETKKKKTLFEIKYRSDLKSGWRQIKPKLKAAIRYANSQGWTFKLITEHEIRSAYLKNVQFLLRFRKMPVNDAYEQLLLKRLAELRESDPATLLLAVFRDRWSQAALIPSLWRLISVGSIGANLDAPLTMTSRIWSTI
jgi:hypothetical protein